MHSKRPRNHPQLQGSPCPMGRLTPAVIKPVNRTTRRMPAMAGITSAAASTAMTG